MSGSNAVSKPSLSNKRHRFREKATLLIARLRHGAKHIQRGSDTSDNDVAAFVPVAAVSHLQHKAPDATRGKQRFYPAEVLGSDVAYHSSMPYGKHTALCSV